MYKPNFGLLSVSKPDYLLKSFQLLAFILIFSLALAFFTSQIAQAANISFGKSFTESFTESFTFRGKIERINNENHISESRTKLSLKMDYTNDISKQQIDRLGPGDYVSVTATVDEINPNLIYVSSVDYVGLQTLLGTWKSAINLCYEFTGFTTFYVYTPNSKGLCLRQNNKNSTKPQPNKYNFFINPDIDAWNLLISSPDNNFVGELMIHDADNIEIQLFDNQTDAVLDSIVLRRLLSADSQSKRSLLF